MIDTGYGQMVSSRDVVGVDYIGEFETKDSYKSKGKSDCCQDKPVLNDMGRPMATGAVEPVHPEAFIIPLPPILAFLRYLKFGSSAAKGLINIIPEGKLANHLFKGVEKLVDTPSNRTLIQNISNSKPLVIDKFGKTWYRGVDDSGKAIYSYTQNGVVKGAGYTNSSAKEMIIKYGVK